MRIARLALLAVSLAACDGHLASSERAADAAAMSADGAADAAPAAGDGSEPADGSAAADATAPRPDVTPGDAAVVVPPDGAPPPDGGGAADAAAASLPDGAPPPPDLVARNPVLPGDHPDPHVLRLVDAEGPLYLLTHTVDTGDFPLWRSRDLVRWERAGATFGRGAPGRSNALGEHHYCRLWAPEIVPLPHGYMLSFTATRFRAPQDPCPPYREDSGVYLAWSPDAAGPFARPDHPWEPLPAGGHIPSCGLRDALPRSVDTAVDDCLGGFCHQVIRLDSSVFADPETGRWWLAYAWYTNDPPRVDWERAHHGEHVSIVELDPADPFAVRCAPDVPQIFAVDPHDADLRARLAASCPRCGDMLAFDRGRQDERMRRAGVSWGVAEGPSLIRANGLVYLFFSGSAWDSAYYHVAWVAAPTVEGLVRDNPARLAGRLLVPGGGQAFGHGTPVLGPNGRDWFYVHHRLRHADCRDRGDCARDLWVSPITFEDRGDGRGAVWIRPVFPAETPEVRIPPSL